MAHRLLTPSDYRRMPWKNSGGETVEIAVWPPESDLDSFEWRLSLASVNEDGPFSIFPGIDRHLSVVEGAGIGLAFGNGDAVTLTRATPSFFFPGDMPVSGRLLDGPIVDLNLMVRRARRAATVSRLENGIERPFDLVPCTLVVHAQTPARIVLAGTAIAVDAGCTLIATIAEGTTATATAQRAHLMTITATA